MKIIAVLPAYNAEKTLESTVQGIPEGAVDEVILVDDASQDRTVEIAKSLGLKVFRHSRNRGYGANQKTCYREALARGADVVVMLHPDFQYDPHSLPRVLKPLLNGEADFVSGSRFLGNPIAGGMPRWKWLGNRFLTITENLVLGHSFSEYHSGYRAYTRGFLEAIPVARNADDFVFDQQVMIQAVYLGARVKEVPVATRYLPESSSVGFKVSLVYGLKTLKSLMEYLAHRLRIRKCPWLLVSKKNLVADVYKGA